MTAEALEHLIAERFGVRPVQLMVTATPARLDSDPHREMAGQRHASDRILIPRGGTTRRVPPESLMITVTRTSEPKEDFAPFTIDRDGQKTSRLTRTEAIARLSMFDVEGAEVLVDQAPSMAW